MRIQFVAMEIVRFEEWVVVTLTRAEKIRDTAALGGMSHSVMFVCSQKQSLVVHLYKCIYRDC